MYAVFQVTRGVKGSGVAKCHPERRHEAHGLCAPCYAKTPERRAAAKAYRATHPDTRPSRFKDRSDQQRAYRSDPSVKARILENGRSWARSKRHEPRVYFVLSYGLVKIGTTTSLTARMKAFRMHSAAPVKLLFSVPGGADKEAQFHARFSASRSHGEWFRYSEIADQLELIRGAK